MTKTNDTEQRITPFSSGTEAMIWESRNCDLCAKQWDGNLSKDAECKIEEAIALAAIGDHTIPLEMWKRAGVGIGGVPQFDKWVCYGISTGQERPFT